MVMVLMLIKIFLSSEDRKNRLRVTLGFGTVCLASRCSAR